MASEIRLTVSLSAYKPPYTLNPLGRSINDLAMTWSGTTFIQGEMLVPTAALSIPLGQVSSPHWCFFMNHDPTNVVTIRNGGTGADLLGFLPGEGAWVPLLLTVVPFAVANTAPCYLEYLILSL